MKCQKIKKMRLWAAFLLLMTAVCGCGADKAEEVTAQVDAVQEQDENDAECAGERSEWELSEEDPDGSMQQAEEELVIDEATKEELTTQMLQENELDLSVINSTEATRGCTFTLPEGFTESEEVPGMYMTKRYPIDASLISYMEMDKDISLQLMTEESFLAQMQTDFKQLYDTDIEVDLKSYEKTEISGYPAFRILCSYILDGVEITQLAYVINADKSYVVTYSQTSEYDRMEEFEASAATIQLELD